MAQFESSNQAATAENQFWGRKIYSVGLVIYAHGAHVDVLRSVQSWGYWALTTDSAHSAPSNSRKMAQFESSNQADTAENQFWGENLLAMWVQLCRRLFKLKWSLGAHIRAQRATNTGHMHMGRHLEGVSRAGEPMAAKEALMCMARLHAGIRRWHAPPPHPAGLCPRA